MPSRVGKPGRLVFVLDLTGSRSSSLKQARVATAAMFDAIKRIGSVAVKLIYYRGNECKAGSWEKDPATVSRAMQRLSCEVGGTQIARALQCVLKREAEVSGVVFIGDHCEDDPEELMQTAAALGEKHMPVFVFHECEDGDRVSCEARTVFKRIAELSGGFYSMFEPDSANVMGELLSSVAAFTVAGIEGVKPVEPATTPQARKLQTRLLLGPGGDFTEDK